MSAKGETSKRRYEARFADVAQLVERRLPKRCRGSWHATTDHDDWTQPCGFAAPGGRQARI